jgi:protein gp37
VWGPKGRRIIAPEWVWRQPYDWDREAAAAGERQRVFCLSMGDVFEDRPELVAPRARIFRRCLETPNLDWLLLTKRPENAAAMLPGDWGDGYPSVWLGVSIEDDRYAWRAEVLRSIPAVCRFVSYEPVLGPLDGLDLAGISWVIIGGESGPNYRTMNLEHLARAVERCRAFGVWVFVKQDSGMYPDRRGRIPADLWAVKEFPVPRRQEERT